MKEEAKKEFTTDSGIPVKAVYTPDDLKGFDYSKNLGLPGSYPYTRGLYPEGYRASLWMMRQQVGFGSPEETRQRIDYLSQLGGQKGFFDRPAVALSFDTPSHMGLDSDNPMAEGEIGRVGVPMSCLKDMETVIGGFPLDRTFINMPAYDASVTMIQTAMVIATAEKQGVSPDKLFGNSGSETFQNFICCNCSLYPLKPALRLTADLFEFCAKNMPKWTPVAAYGNAYREVGGTAVQEVAFTLAHAAAYLELAMQRGIDVDAFAPRMSFYMNSNNDFFEEIAKLRAARRIWARMVKERYGAKNPKSWLFRVFSRTTGVALTAQQPHNNIVRSTIHALAAVLGGTQGILITHYDEGLSIPSEHAHVMTIRTQQIIAEETNVTNTVDPLAGSYFVESLTNSIESRVLEYHQKIEGMGGKAGKGGRMLGGVIAGIQSGFFRNDVFEASLERKREIDDGKRVVVGVNKYVVEERVPVQIMKVSLDVERKRVEQLRQFRQERNGAAVRDALSKLHTVAQGTDNLMPAVIEAVKRHATLGEIVSALKEEFAEPGDKDKAAR